MSDYLDYVDVTTAKNYSAMVDNRPSLKRVFEWTRTTGYGLSDAGHQATMHVVNGHQSLKLGPETGARLYGAPTPTADIF